MTESETEIPPVLKPASAPAPTSSLLARLLNIFAIPGPVFEEVRLSRHAAGNWLVPTALCCLVLAAWGYVASCIPEVQKRVDGVQAAQAAAMAEAVKAGKVTQAEADQSLKAINSIMQPVVLKMLAAGGGLLWGAVRLFWWSLLLWVLARAFLRQPIPYAKAMEVAGLASMISMLGTVALLALTVNLRESFGPSGFELSVSNLADSENQTLSAVVLNVMRFWFLMVLGTGLARLTGVPWFRAAFLIFVCWLAGDLLLIFLGLGALAG